MDAVFFPEPPNRSYSVEVCKHRLGRKMTYTEDTDLIRGNCKNWILPLMKSKGIKYSNFSYGGSLLEDHAFFKQYIADGDLWLDIYFYTPNAAGGTISQEMYEEYRDLNFEVFQKYFGIRPIAYSYSYGNPSFRPYVGKDFLGARCSGQTSYTDYGVGCGNPNNVPYGTEMYSEYPPEHNQYGDYLFKPSTLRWQNMVIDNIPSPTAQDFDNVTQYVSELIDATLLNNGWINNFIHISDVYDAGEMQQQAYERYVTMLAQKNANNEIYFAGYGEAVAYLVYRQMVKRGVMYSPSDNPQNELIIRLETDNSQLQVNTDLLVIPISVKFSTVGTPLEGQTIKSDRNLISLGNNQYIIEIPFSRFPVARIEKI